MKKLIYVLMIFIIDIGWAQTYDTISDGFNRNANPIDGKWVNCSFPYNSTVTCTTGYGGSAIAQTIGAAIYDSVFNANQYSKIDSLHFTTNQGGYGVGVRMNLNFDTGYVLFRSVWNDPENPTFGKCYLFKRIYNGWVKLDSVTVGDGVTHEMSLVVLEDTLRGYISVAGVGLQSIIKIDNSYSVGCPGIYLLYEPIGRWFGGSETVGSVQCDTLTIGTVNDTCGTPVTIGQVLNNCGSIITY